MGEPLLHPLLDDIIAIVAEAGAWACLSTNGILLTAERMKKLVEAGLKHIIISMDSVNPSTFERMRPGVGMELVRDNVVGALEWLRTVPMEQRTTVEIQRIDTTLNPGESEEWREFWGPKVEGLGYLTDKPFDPWAGEVPALGTKNESGFQCTMLNYSLSILWNGDITVCCHDYDGWLRLGNLNEMTLEQAWRSPKMEEWREAHSQNDRGRLPSMCRGCYLTEKGVVNVASVRKILWDAGGFPHFSMDAVLALAQIITPQTRVVETGSGGSTLWFGRRVGHVVAWEDQSVWAHVVREAIEIGDLTAMVEVREQKNYSTGAFQSPSEEEKNTFDLVVLDGEDYIGCRVATMKAAPQWVRPGGYVFIDDAERTDYEEGIEYLRSLGWESTTFTGSDLWGERKSAILFKTQDGANHAPVLNLKKE
jgi:radical SAM protein with 4Fe4S-binding SPASM domain